MTMTEAEQTARACLEELVKLVPDAGNVDALMGGSAVDSAERVQEVLEKLRLKPELRDDVSVDELATHFGSPVVLELTNGNWVIFLGCRRGAAGEEEHYAVFDPLSRESGKVIFLKVEALQKAWGGRALFLRNFANQN
ncbi:MAG: hypothetical protein UHH87_00960, partial [Akkermansia sp.]|nr:hypothetical protein [Akkermansia sp.]